MRRSDQFPFYAVTAFVLAAVVYVVQTIPIVGLIGLLLMLPYWLALLVNLGMVLLVIEHGVGRCARGWLVLPIVFYGGYFVVAAIGNVEAERLRSEIVADNQRARTMSLDVAGRPLVAANKELARYMLTTHDLPEVFWNDDRFGQKSRSVLRIGDKAACAIASAEGRTGLAYLEDDFRSYRPLATGGACRYSLPHEPDGPTVAIEQSSRKIERALTRAELTTTKVTDAQGRVATLTDGRIWAPSWVPLFIAACYPGIDAAPAFCGFDFIRDGLPDLAPTISADITRLIGRLPSSFDKKAPTFSGRADPDLDDLPRKNREAAEATVARMLSDPRLALTDRDSDFIAAHADPLRLDLDTAIRQLGAHLDGGDGQHWQTTITLIDLIIAQPADRFAVIAPRFAEILEARLAAWRGGANWTITRLARRGPGTAPVLVQLFRSSDLHVKEVVLESLCFMGADAAQAADDVAAFITTYPAPKYDRSLAEFTLRRMGRSDLIPAGGEPDPQTGESPSDPRAEISPPELHSRCH